MSNRNNDAPKPGRNPNILVVAAVSVIIITLTGAVITMGGLIFQFSRGERLFGSEGVFSESDTLVIRQSEVTDAVADVAGVEAAVNITPSAVSVQWGDRTMLGAVVGGSGYIITADGGNSGDIKVVFGSGGSYAARVIKRDQATGIVLLKIAASNLRAAVFADSDKVAQGGRIYKISLVADEVSVFEGVVSAVREVDTALGPVPAIAADMVCDGSDFILLVNTSGEVVAAGSCLKATVCSAAYSSNYVRSFAEGAGAGN